MEHWEHWTRVSTKGPPLVSNKVVVVFGEWLQVLETETEGTGSGGACGESWGVGGTTASAPTCLLKAF